jgi:hypothetical protein
MLNTYLDDFYELVSFPSVGGVALKAVNDGDLKQKSHSSIPHFKWVALKHVRRSSVRLARNCSIPYFK